MMLFSGHEGLLLHNVRSDHGRVNHEAISYVAHQNQDGVSKEEHLRDVISANGTYFSI